LSDNIHVQDMKLIKSDKISLVTCSLLLISTIICNIIVYGLGLGSVKHKIQIASLNYLIILSTISIIFAIIYYNYRHKNKKTNISHLLFSSNRNQINYILFLVGVLYISIISILSNNLHSLNNNTSFLVIGDYTLYWLIFTELLVSSLLVLLVLFSKNRIVHYISVIIYTLSLLILNPYIQYTLQSYYTTTPTIPCIAIYILLGLSYICLINFIVLQCINRCCKLKAHILIFISLISQLLFFFINIVILILHSIQINKLLIPWTPPPLFE